MNKQFNVLNIMKNSNLFLLFIILQPILDVLTAFSIYYFQASITIGLLVRMGFMLISIVYIFFLNNSKYKKIITGYLIVFLTIVGVGFLTNYFIKPNFSLFSELQYTTKSVYFVIMFLSYLLVLTSLNYSSKMDKFQSFIVYSMVIVGVVLLFTQLTGTGFDTYKYNKAGNKGWFYSGNELSAILSICFPMVVLFAVRKTTSLKNSYFWIPVLVVGFAAIMVGTKVGHLAIILVCALTPILLAVELLVKKIGRLSSSINIKLNLIISIAIVIAVAVITPITPAFTNTSGHYSSVAEEIAEESSETEVEADSATEDIAEEPEKEKKENFTAKLLDNKVLSVLLSSRDKYFIKLNNDFIEAPAQQKMFGMGYAGNWEKAPKLIEMDFFDLFYSFGIIGFTAFMLPFLSIVLVSMKQLLRLKLQLIRPNVLFPLMSIALAVGIAFLAGHVLYAPAVSIYVSVILAIILAQITAKSNQTT
ncbi:O-antigen ligase family protein [Bacillus sp. RO1]|uniref:O-antigen ligase family protein n=1 Tax=Bacillus sp. RO1 TaxID=2722703 RepID=UPI001456E0F1|nr:O-antigen ligase family protein [Bacillus sp. RO1]NLP52714.1 O-antigen ligase family protein [Bacillus sp. RO1]